MSNLPSLILGTAMWGWTIDQKEAFSLLDHFYEEGGRIIDAATNYPINKNPDDFRKSEKILQAWINSHGVKDLSIIMKVGSISNMRTPDHNLSPSFLLMNKQHYLGIYGDNLDTLMIHWDNRKDWESIRDTARVLIDFQKEGLKIGLSGIQSPHFYAKAFGPLNLQPSIQIKHNLLYSDYPRYQDFYAYKGFLTYGINAGGLKLNPKAYHDRSSYKVRGGRYEKIDLLTHEINLCIQAFNQQQSAYKLSKMNEVAMIFALLSLDIGGVLIGPSRRVQLEESLAFYKKMESVDFEDCYQQLLKIHRKYAPSNRQI